MRIIAKFSLLFLVFAHSLIAKDSTVVQVFSDNIILFGHVEQENIKTADFGQTISKVIEIPKYSANCKIFANVRIIMNGENGDPWDRAGTIYMSNGSNVNVELLKFMTAYGVPTNHRTEISNLYDLLEGKVEIIAHIPSNPDFNGFKIDFKLVFYEDLNVKNADWAKGIFFNNSLEKKHITEGLTKVNVQIPAGLDKVYLNYLSSGHCTDGRGADEFESKFNVIYIDGQEVYRYKPWREDCGDFPSNGNYWLSRSGWCPGDIVEPLEIDLTQYLGAGEHEIEFIIEDIRGIDENNNYGYWKVSSYLTGFLSDELLAIDKIDIRSNAEKVFPKSSEFRLDISFVDVNGNLIINKEKQISITTNKKGLLFSENKITWEESLLIPTSDDEKIIFVRGESNGIYNIVVSDLFSSKNTNFEILIAENYSQIANVWGSDSTSSDEAPIYAFDGDLKTKWSDDSQRFPNTLVATFDEVTELNYFVLYHAGSAGEPYAYNTIDYELQYYDSISATWERIVKVQDNYDTEKGNITTHYLENSIITNSIKLNILYPEADGIVARLYEFQMFNISKVLYDDITLVNKDETRLPNSFSLNQNYPNPFNPSTTISFVLPLESNVKLRVYNLNGSLVEVLEEGILKPANYDRIWNANNISSGMYFIQLSTPFFTRTIKSILIK